VGKVPVESRGSLIVRAVERVACGPPQRVGGILLALERGGVPGVDHIEGSERVQRIERV